MQYADVTALMQYADVTALMQYADVTALMQYADVTALMQYADVTALIKNSKEVLEQLTDNVNEVEKQLNLKCNVKKTKLMITEAKTEEYLITIDGEKVEQVQSLKYLGYMNTTTTACSGDTKSRITIAKRRVIELQYIWNDRILSKDLRVRPVKALVWSALTYVQKPRPSSNPMRTG